MIKLLYSQLESKERKTLSSLVDFIPPKLYRKTVCPLAYMPIIRNFVGFPSTMICLQRDDNIYLKNMSMKLITIGTVCKSCKY